MKKRIITALLITFLLSISGCAVSENNAPSSAAPETSTPSATPETLETQPVTNEPWLEAYPTFLLCRLFYGAMTRQHIFNSSKLQFL
ncbi:hypothetical protein NDS46_16290 [Paenibacillus thiaminolyticus]|uniref:hypothetical protein n=1 Tax=Paenibacillus thiaminolyticus TaxID=49283 RepID=UPI00232F2AC1|nr:hypothetical protein [Paenibacillus thiaminolyticus]WCF05935.1 hypothetical protein NDS46_16290 [Paenibacillus thiaminolyticus]